MSPVAVIDVDGTLVDTNYQHAIAWYRAFRDNGIVLPMWRIHRHIGMGGDHMVPTFVGERVAEDKGDDIRAAEKELFAELIDECEPMDGARDLLVELKKRGHSVVLASSAKQEELDHYLELLDAAEVADGWTSSADVEATKPEPDIVEAALDKVSDRDGVMIGDSTFDCIAAERAGLKTIGVLTGGFSEQELREAGAAAVFESISELRERLDETPLA
ncbi:MAG TPA: HAD family hydrolase [Actinomycetota bacterium]|nr:HAD family hydrolase [Actinomycetota bacterium]